MRRYQARVVRRAVLQALILPGVAVCRPRHPGPGSRPADREFTPTRSGQGLHLRASEPDGLRRPQRGEVETSKEAHEPLANVALVPDRGEQPPSLARVDHDPSVYGRDDERGRPAHRVDWIGLQQTQLDRVSKHVVQDGPLPCHSRRCRRFAVQTPSQQVQCSARQLRPSRAVLDLRQTHGVSLEPTDRRCQLFPWRTGLTRGGDIRPTKLRLPNNLGVRLSSSCRYKGRQHGDQRLRDRSSGLRRRSGPLHVDVSTGMVKPRPSPQLPQHRLRQPTSPIERHAFVHIGQKLGAICVR